MTLTSSVVRQMMARFRNFYNAKKKSRLSLKRRSAFRTGAKIYLSKKIFWGYGHFNKIGFLYDPVMHMAQSRTYWDASHIVGLLKQSKSYQSTLTCLCFEKSHYATCVPACVILYRDRIAQRAHYFLYSIFS